MEEERTVLYKSFLFAQRMVRLYKHLLTTGQPRALADQLLRSGTSIGANLEEATGGFSRRDFAAAAKCSIAYKEARETHYWLRLLRATECLEPRLADSLLAGAEELRRMLSAIVRSSRENSSLLTLTAILRLVYMAQPGNLTPNPSPKERAAK